MPAHAYTENQLVEQPAVGLIAELGWQTRSLLALIAGARAGRSRRTDSQFALDGPYS
jgi:type I restriction enzyme R subunit